MCCQLTEDYEYQILHTKNMWDMNKYNNRKLLNRISSKCSSKDRLDHQI